MSLNYPDTSFCNSLTIFSCPTGISQTRFAFILVLQPSGDNMITAYHRPSTIDEALKLLANSKTLPLGGGTHLSRSGSAPLEVVDLQALGFNILKKNGNNLEIGATVTLQQLLESEYASDALKIAVKREAPLNIRNAATVAGSLVTAGGRSTFATAMLALDAKLTIEGQRSAVENLGEFLPLRPNNLRGMLITALTVPLNTKLAFEIVSRTPLDKPVVCAALAIWPSGRTRLALGGYGSAPMLAMDGTESEGLVTAARNTFHEATDEWAGAEYRMEVAATLVERCRDSII
jgi:CO/xanthine dehydrogenase FAD-binding subunit